MSDYMGKGIFCVGCYEEAKYDAGEGATSCICNHTWVRADGLIEVSSFRHMGLSPMTRERYLEWKESLGGNGDQAEEDAAQAESERRNGWMSW